MTFQVAMLGWEFPPAITGGLGIHCFELCLGLANLGVKIDLYLPKQRQPIISPHPNINLIEVDESYKIGVYDYFRKGSNAKDNYSCDLMGAIESFSKETARLMQLGGKKYDLVHCHDWLTIPAGIKAKQALGVPLVLTIHSTEYDRNPFPWKMIADIEIYGIRNADLTIAVSNMLKRTIMERLGVADKEIRVIHNGVDASKYLSARKIKRNGKFVLFLGRLTHQKGPEQFIFAAKRVLDHMRDVNFIVVGEGNMLPRLISLTISLGIQDRVSFWGFVPESEKHKIYSLCDVYVMPSISEPFGISALEAMASGTPCIISKSAGVSEVAKNCLLVDFWDIEEMASKILALLRYPCLSATLSKMQIDEILSLGWDRTAKKTLEAYKDALKCR